MIYNISKLWHRILKTVKIVNSQTKNDGLIFGKYLLLTNTLSAAALMLVGESVAQKIENSQNLNDKQIFDYDKMKQMSIVGAGLGPIHHVSENYCLKIN